MPSMLPLILEPRHVESEPSSFQHIKNCMSRVPPLNDDPLRVFASIIGAVWETPSIDPKELQNENPETLVLHSEIQNTNLGSVELAFSLMSSHDQQAYHFLGADAYEDFVAMYWPTSTSFRQLMKHVIALQDQVSRVSTAEIGSRANFEKDHYGIYFHCQSEIHHIPLDKIGSVHLPSVLSFCEESSDQVRKVVIALPFADVHYDYVQIHSHWKRVGLATHILGINSQVAKFIEATNERHANTVEIIKAVEIIFDRVANAGRN